MDDKPAQNWFSRNLTTINTVLGIVAGLAIFANLLIKNFSLEHKNAELVKQIEHCENSGADEHSHEQCLSPADLVSLSERFQFGHDKSDNTTFLKKIMKKAEELEGWESNFFFRLLRIELTIPRFGQYINTRVPADTEDKLLANKRIQFALQEIGFYQGSIDGNQQATFNALRRFQETLNDREGRLVFNPEDFGFFGYRTLEAIRSEYRRRRN